MNHKAVVDFIKRMYTKGTYTEEDLEVFVTSNNKIYYLTEDEKDDILSNAKTN